MARNGVEQCTCNAGAHFTLDRQSVTHTDESVDRYVAVFEEMAAELTA